MGHGPQVRWLGQSIELFVATQDVKITIGKARPEVAGKGAPYAEDRWQRAIREKAKART